MKDKAMEFKCETPDDPKECEEIMKRIGKRFERMQAKALKAKADWMVGELGLLEKKLLSVPAKGKEETRLKARLLAGIALLGKAVEEMGAVPFAAVASALADLRPVTPLTGKKGEWGPLSEEWAGEGKMSRNKRFPLLVRFEDGTVSDRVNVIVELRGRVFHHSKPFRTALPKEVQDLMDPLTFPLEPPCYKVYAKITRIDGGFELWVFGHMEDREGHIVSLGFAYKRDETSGNWERIC